MSGYGEATCIECGVTSERLLLARFPHICRRCLFPPKDAQALVDDLRVKLIHTRSATRSPWTEQRS